MADRIIFHADCNNFFASCECLERPELKNVPLAVAGDPQERLGVVVAKNELAKKYGVKTTDTVYAAKKKCPDIVFVKPRHHFYRQISDKVNQIYREYTEYVEPASIDESYLDMTEAVPFYQTTPRALADELRDRMREEIGITISVGVSFNKVFAKMGSDYKKPDATTVITREAYRDILWPLPVGTLLFAGRASVEKLKRRDIRTIGDLANCSEDALRTALGKQGEMLWRYANGMDDEPVRLFGDRAPIKSVSRGRTFPRDLVTEEQVVQSVNALVDEVARTLRRHDLKGEVVTAQIRRPDMTVISRQTTLPKYTCLHSEIRDAAIGLIKEHWTIGEAHPIRALTVGVTKLLPKDDIAEQVSLFDLIEDDGEARRKREKLEKAIDEVRKKHGTSSITLGFEQE